MGQPLGLLQGPLLMGNQLLFKTKTSYSLKADGPLCGFTTLFGLTAQLWCGPQILLHYLFRTDVTLLGQIVCKYPYHATLGMEIHYKCICNEFASLGIKSCNFKSVFSAWSVQFLGDGDSHSCDKWWPVPWTKVRWTVKIEQILLPK